MSGYFVISLDFEMLWGLMDHDNYIEYSENIIGGVKRAIPSMLDLFEKYNIHSTWAVVGMIYNKDMEECIDRLPLRQPSYSIPKMATYYRFGCALWCRGSSTGCCAAAHGSGLW